MGDKTPCSTVFLKEVNMTLKKIDEVPSPRNLIKKELEDFMKSGWECATSDIIDKSKIRPEIVYMVLRQRIKDQDLPIIVSKIDNVIYFERK